MADIVNKKSNMTITLRLETASTSGDDGGFTALNWTLLASSGLLTEQIAYHNTTYKIVLDGLSFTGTVRNHQAASAGTAIANGTIYIPHNYVESKAIAYSIDTTTTQAGAGAGDAVISASGTHTLDTIQIASQIIVPTVNIGVAPVITINKCRAGYTNTLTYTFGSHGGTIVEKTSATSYNGFTYPQTFYAEIPNAKYGIGVITCETYNGTTLIGSSHTEFRANVNEAASTPTIFPTIKDVNAATIALTGDDDIMVRYMSIASVTIGAEARNYATIKHQICANGGQAVVNATGTIEGVEHAKFSLSATDSRGYTTAVSFTKPFVEYALPTCNIVNTLPDTAGNMTVRCDGTYWAGNFGAANNTLTAQYRYKTKSGGDYTAWADMVVTTDGNSYTAAADLSGLDYRTTYVFQVRATDALATATSGGSDVVSLPVFHWSESDFVFEVPVTFNKGAEGIESGDEDVDLSDYYTKDEVYSKSEVDEMLADTGDDVSASFGSWTPSLNTSAAVSAYTTQSGWYMKVGNVVTIGFYLKAECNSGYQATVLSIKGLPFTPAQAAFGGGVLHNAYVATGYNFEAWAVTTGGDITPRLQPCNPTSKANLNISSTAYYINGGGTMTLGGTITYFTND